MGLYQRYMYPQCYNIPVITFWGGGGKGGGEGAVSVLAMADDAVQGNDFESHMGL